MDQGNIPTLGGLGFFGALQVLFIGLKLGHVIDWSWWKVLLPLEIDLGLAAVAVAVYVVLLRKRAL